MILQKRDIEIMEYSNKFQCLSSLQIARLFSMHLKVCQKRLRILVEADYLESVNIPRTHGGICQKLFYLGKQGATLLNATPSKPRFTLQLTHQNKTTDLMIDIIVSIKRKEDIQCEVMSEHEIRISGHINIPDGVLKVRRRDKTALFCLENDCGTEVVRSTSCNWEDIENKCLRYLEQFEANQVNLYENYFTEKFNRFRVLFVCSDNCRLNAISNLLTDEKFHFIWLTTINAFNREGICGNIWNVPSLNESNQSII